jgi:hypothetical protein
MLVSDIENFGSKTRPLKLYEKYKGLFNMSQVKGFKAFSDKDGGPLCLPKYNHNVAGTLMQKLAYFTMDHVRLFEALIHLVISSE